MAGPACPLADRGVGKDERDGKDRKDLREQRDLRIDWPEKAYAVLCVSCLATCGFDLNCAGYHRAACHCAVCHGRLRLCD